MKTGTKVKVTLGKLKDQTGKVAAKKRGEKINNDCVYVLINSQRTLLPISILKIEK